MLVLVGSYTLINAIITYSLKFILKKKLAYNISLNVAKIIYQIGQTIYLCMIVPVTFAYLQDIFLQESIKSEKKW